MNSSLQTFLFLHHFWFNFSYVQGRLCKKCSTCLIANLHPFAFIADFIDFAKLSCRFQKGTRQVYKLKKNYDATRVRIFGLRKKTFSNTLIRCRARGIAVFLTRYTFCCHLSPSQTALRDEYPQITFFTTHMVHQNLLKFHTLTRQIFDPKNQKVD